MGPQLISNLEVVKDLEFSHELHWIGFNANLSTISFMCSWLNSKSFTTSKLEINCGTRLMGRSGKKAGNISGLFCSSFVFVDTNDHTTTIRVYMTKTNEEQNSPEIFPAFFPDLDIKRVPQLISNLEVVKDLEFSHEHINDMVERFALNPIQCNSWLNSKSFTTSKLEINCGPM